MTSSFSRTGAPPADLVRRLLEADARHDLTRYRALLADNFTEQTEGETTSRYGDDAAYAAARSWALAPGAYRRIDEINEAADCVTVRYRLDDAVPVGITSLEQPGNFLGYSIYETRDGHIIRAGHFYSEQRAPEVGSATEHVEPSIGIAAPPRRLRRRAVAALALLLSMVLAEPVWAAPIVATTAWQGGGAAFVILAPAYFAVGYGLSLFVIRRAITRPASGSLERWLMKGARRGPSRVRKLVDAGTVLGFVVSSMLVGPFITTWLWLQIGRRRHIRRDAMASSVIFAVWFVGFYAGVASLIF